MSLIAVNPAVMLVTSPRLLWPIRPCQVRKGPYGPSRPLNFRVISGTSERGICSASSKMQGPHTLRSSSGTPWSPAALRGHRHAYQMEACGMPLKQRRRGYGESVEHSIILLLLVQQSTCVAYKCCSFLKSDCCWVWCSSHFKNIECLCSELKVWHLEGSLCHAIVVF